ncbi:MAG: protein kinase [Clostridia bacterium]|nr:protein kinase [Clostridia bacterium]
MESRLIGKVVSRRFRVEEVIGSGGMAVVYRAFDLKTHQTVALKVLREEYEHDEEYRERFQREAEVGRRLNHPNIVNLVDSGAVGGVRYIALEYVDGKTLKEIIQQQGTMQQEEAVHYALQILAALGHAHSRKIIHRDIKPQNLMVTRSGQLKMGDFGIAGIADTKTLTGDGSVIGSVHYFSPEQAKGMRATEASDLYSVGVILYEMLTGHVPFEGETAVSVAMMHLMKEPTPVEEEAEVSPALAKIIHKALAKLPQERYQSADAMIRDLRRGLRHPDGAFMDSEKRRRGTQERGDHAPVTGRQRILILSLAAVLAALACFAGYRLYRTVFVVSDVPDLAGLDAAGAEKMLSGSDLQMGVQWEYDETVAEGFVIGQEPEAGTTVDKGSSILVRLSMGSNMIMVPYVSGMTQQEAETLITESGFTVGEITGSVSEVIRGMVISQEPEAGARRRTGEAVNLTVSIGRVIVPELTNLREEEALQRIEQVGLAAGEIAYRETRSPTQDGVVLEQSLPQFMDVEPGQVISLTVGRYRQWDKTYAIQAEVDVPESGCTIRVTLVDGAAETEMYSARHETPGAAAISVTLRSETSGPKKWRLYVDGNLKEEHEITIL